MSCDTSRDSLDLPYLPVEVLCAIGQHVRDPRDIFALRLSSRMFGVFNEYVPEEGCPFSLFDRSRHTGREDERRSDWLSGYSPVSVLVFPDTSVNLRSLIRFPQLREAWGFFNYRCFENESKPGNVSLVDLLELRDFSRGICETFPGHLFLRLHVRKEDSTPFLGALNLLRIRLKNYPERSIAIEIHHEGDNYCERNKTGPMPFRLGWFPFVPPEDRERMREVLKGWNVDPRVPNRLVLEMVFFRTSFTWRVDRYKTYDESLGSLLKEIPFTSLSFQLLETFGGWDYRPHAPYGKVLPITHRILSGQGLSPQQLSSVLPLDLWCTRKGIDNSLTILGPRFKRLILRPQTKSHRLTLTWYYLHTCFESLNLTHLAVENLQVPVSATADLKYFSGTSVVSIFFPPIPSFYHRKYIKDPHYREEYVRVPYSSLQIWEQKMYEKERTHLPPTVRTVHFYSQRRDSFIIRDSEHLPSCSDLP